MEETNGQETKYNPGLRLPRPKTTSIQYPEIQINESPPMNKKKSNLYSPKDTTPIIVNGEQILREDLTPIVEQPINSEPFFDSQDKIDLLENPSIINDILNDSPTVLNNVPSDMKTLRDSMSSSESFPIVRSNTPLQEPKKTESEETNDFNISPYDKIKNYKRFNPPFPENSSKGIRQFAAYVESVESTDTSALGLNIQPRVTSPVDTLSIDTRLREQERREQERREQERREQERREQERREQERREQERREQERREQERREQERREQERNEQEKKEKDKKEETLSQDELVSRAQDCFLKYQILQKSWQEYKFPNIEEKLVHTNPQMVIDNYRISVERIQIDMDVNQYKIALIIMFLVIEVVSVKLLGLNAGGYTLSQIKAMNRYERLLIEIGEKKMMIGGESWPPEVRILFIGLFNCGLFILMKYLSSVLGPELVGYISPIVNGLFSGALDTSKTSNLPDEIPQKQQDISGMLGGVASMAAKALSGNQPAPSNNIPQSRGTRASRRPVYRE
jgi:hypothetical protein